MRSVGCQWGELHGVAEALQAANQPVLDVTAIPLVEVVVAEVMVGGALGEQVVSDDEDAVADRHRRLRLAPTRRQPAGPAPPGSSAWSGPPPSPPRSALPAARRCPGACG